MAAARSDDDPGACPDDVIVATGGAPPVLTWPLVVRCPHSDDAGALRVATADAFLVRAVSIRQARHATHCAILGKEDTLLMPICHRPAARRLSAYTIPRVVTQTRVARPRLTRSRPLPGPGDLPESWLGNLPGQRGAAPPRFCPDRQPPRHGAGVMSAEPTCGHPLTAQSAHESGAS